MIGRLIDRVFQGMVMLGLVLIFGPIFLVVAAVTLLFLVIGGFGQGIQDAKKEEKNK